MLYSNNGTIQEFGLVEIYFVQFLHFGSNSSAGSNPGIDVRTLSWEFVSRHLPHRQQCYLEAWV